MDDSFGLNDVVADDFGLDDKPAPAPLPTGKYLGKKFSQSALAVTSGIPMAVGGLAGLFGADNFRDKMFDITSGMNRAADDVELGVGTDDSLQSGKERFGGVLVGAAPYIGAAVASPPLALLPLASMSGSDAARNLDSGLSLGKTAQVFGTDMVGNVAGALLPAAFGTKVLTKVGTAVGGNVAQGTVTDAIKQEIVDGTAVTGKYDPFNPEARLADAVIGFGGGVHQSMPIIKTRQRANAAQADQSRNFGRFSEEADAAAQARATVAEEQVANATASKAANEAAQAAKNSGMAEAILKAAKEIPTRQAPEQTVGEQPTVKKSAFNPKNQQTVYTRDSLDAETGEANPAIIDKTGTIAEDSAYFARLREAENLTKNGSVAEAFKIAMSRQAQADKDLANSGQISPDYQGGLSASTGGQFDSGTRTTFIAGNRTFEPMYDFNGNPRIDDKGRVFGKLTDADGNEVSGFVKTSKIKQIDTPVNQRLGQDSVARSSQPKAGVGEGTMAREKMPRRSTDRISGDIYGGKASAIDDPYSAAPRNFMGKAEAIPKEPVAESPKQPRQGITVDGVATRVDGIKPLANNASGESAASAEAISRTESAKVNDQPTIKINKYGEQIPIRGVDAADAKAYDGDVIFQKNIGKDEWTVVRQGNDVTEGNINRARTYLPKAEPQVAESAKFGTSDTVVPHETIATPEPLPKPDFEARVKEKSDTLKQRIPDMDWAERGGYIIRHPETGEVTGRTLWQPKDYEFDAIRQSEGTTFTKMQEAVTKATNGEKLTPKQQAIVGRVMDLHDHITKQKSMSDAEHTAKLENDINYREAVEQQHIDEVNKLLDDASYDWKKELTDADIQATIDGENAKSKAPEPDITTSRKNEPSEDSVVGKDSAETQQTGTVEKRVDDISRRNDGDKPTEGAAVREPEPVKPRVSEESAFTENELAPRFLNSKSKTVEIDGTRVTPETAVKYLKTVREEIDSYKNFINCMRA